MIVLLTDVLLNCFYPSLLCRWTMIDYLSCIWTIETDIDTARDRGHFITEHELLYPTHNCFNNNHDIVWTIISSITQLISIKLSYRKGRQSPRLDTILISKPCIDVWSSWDSILDYIRNSFESRIFRHSNSSYLIN